MGGRVVEEEQQQHRPRDGQTCGSWFRRESRELRLFAPANDRAATPWAPDVSRPLPSRRRIHTLSSRKVSNNMASRHDYVCLRLLFKICLLGRRKHDRFVAVRQAGH